MIRPALALLALGAVAALAGCADEEDGRCPGAPVAALRLEGTRVPAGDPAAAPYDPVPEVADCGEGVGYPEPGPEATLPRPLEGTLSADAGTGAAALCPSSGNVLFGQRSGARFEVETGTSGAILGGCSPSCAATLRLVVRGDLVVGEDGEAVGFEGLLVEELSHADGECGACLPPVPGSAPPRRGCAARYAITGGVP